MNDSAAASHPSAAASSTPPSARPTRPREGLQPPSVSAAEASAPGGAGLLESLCGIRVTPPEENPKVSDDPRLGRLALQAVARDWLWDSKEGLAGAWHRLAGCMRWPSNEHGFLASGCDRFVDIKWDPSRNRAYYSGLQTCGSAWVDPVCSGVIFDKRKFEVGAALDWARENGHSVWFITLTARHSKNMELASLLGGLNRAMRRVYAGKAFQQFKAAHGYLGSIRGTEITNGRNGWHPHFHGLWFTAGGTLDELQAYVDKAWAAALKAEGLTGLRGIRAVVKESSMTADAYITKFGRDRDWDLDAEMTMWARKNGDRGGASPWDLLRAGLRGVPEDVVGKPGERVYLQVQKRCRELFREYAAATKGLHSMRWSAGLKKAVGLVDVSDDEVAAGEANAVELVILARLTVAQWRVVVGNDLRGELLAVAGTGDYGLVAGFLARIGVTLPASVDGLAAEVAG